MAFVHAIERDDYKTVYAFLGYEQISGTTLSKAKSTDMMRILLSHPNITIAHIHDACNLALQCFNTDMIKLFIQRFNTVFSNLLLSDFIIDALADNHNGIFEIIFPRIQIAFVADKPKLLGYNPTIQRLVILLERCLKKKDAGNEQANTILETRIIRTCFITNKENFLYNCLLMSCPNVFLRYIKWDKYTLLIKSTMLKSLDAYYTLENILDDDNILETLKYARKDPNFVYSKECIDALAAKKCLKYLSILIYIKKYSTVLNNADIVHDLTITC